MHDTLIPHLLDYMERKNFAWGLYIALFQGRYEGVYCGTYKIIEIEVLDVY